MSISQTDSLISNVTAGSLAAITELTLGGNIVSVTMTNQIAPNVEKVTASKAKGFFYHYYGRSYAINLACRVPFISSIMGGIWLADRTIERISHHSAHSFPPIEKIAIRSIFGGTCCLPIVLFNERILVNFANNDASLKAIFSKGLKGFKVNLPAIWLRETIFISGPICSSKHFDRIVLSPLIGENSSPTMPRTLFCSSVTGIATAIFSQPMHVISITQQSEERPKNFIRTAKEIKKKNGIIQGLFMKGLRPRLFRIGLLSGILVYSFDFFKKSLSSVDEVF